MMIPSTTGVPGLWRGMLIALLARRMCAPSCLEDAQCTECGCAQGIPRWCRVPISNSLYYQSIPERLNRFAHAAGRDGTFPSRSISSHARQAKPNSALFELPNAAIDGSMCVDQGVHSQSFLLTLFGYICRLHVNPPARLGGRIAAKRNAPLPFYHGSYVAPMKGEWEMRRNLSTRASDPVRRQQCYCMRLKGGQLCQSTTTLCQRWKI